MSPTPGRDPERISRKKHDLLIVGGGITGACLAWDASLRGLRVALVDQVDFAAATSSSTSKMIHGGLRYLKNGEIGLVRESLRERRILQAIAPHLVWPLRFMIPTYKTGNLKWMIKAGMMAYHMLAFDRNRGMDADHRMPGHESLSPAEVLSREPGVDAEALTGGAVYYDGQCNPERLTLEFILGARELGATCLNYARVEAVKRDKAGDVDVDVLDRLTGRHHSVCARMVANTAGPWADGVDSLFGTGESMTLLRSKGIHIVTRSICRDNTLVLRTRQGRHFFIIPWRGMSLIGTTDTSYEGALDDLSASDEDVQTFLDEINGAYPSAGLTIADVRYRYVGVRPLVEQETQVYKASRRYEIVDHHQDGSRGLISAVGGKYTTSRNLAEKLTDRILNHLDRPAVQCLTEKRMLPGGMEGRIGEWVAQQLETHKQALPPECLEHLLRTYGTRFEGVLERAASDPALAEPIAEGRPEIMAEVAFAIECEQALTLTDVLVRRTGIGTIGHPGDEVLDRLAALAGRLLGWDEQRLALEKARFMDKVAGLPETHFPDTEPTAAAI
jgi:glycerol-3-phosphate dehydrogenase